MLTVQQAVFTVESLIGKVQQQKQLIHQLVQENEHLRHENKQLRKENRVACLSPVEVCRRLIETESHMALCLFFCIFVDVLWHFL